jgi:glucose/arabinose dehydrogenase
VPPSQISNPTLFSFGLNLQGASREIATVNFNNSKALFSIGQNDNQTYYKYQLTPGGNWSNWTSLGGQSRHIAVGSNLDGGLVVFSIALDNTPYYKYQISPGGNWSQWIDLGGKVSYVTTAKDNIGNLMLFSIGLNDNTPYYKYRVYPGGNWSNWTSLGGQSKNISLGNDKNGNLVIFSVGYSNNVPYYKYQLSPGGNWSNWTKLGGHSKFVTAGNDKVGNLMLFSIGLNDSTPYYKYQLHPGGNWSNWTSLGGQSKFVTSSKDRDGNLVVFSLSPENTVYYNYNLDKKTKWSLLLGIAKSNQIIVNQDIVGDMSLFMVSSQYNQTFYNELSLNSLPILRDKTLKIDLVTNGLSFPTSMAFLNNETILVLEKNSGKVREISNGKLQRDPILQVNVEDTGERGLLGIGTYPNNSQGKSSIYLYYTELVGDKTNNSLHNRLYRYGWDSGFVNKTLLLDLPAKYVDHNGGKIIVSKDGAIYTVIGDQNMSGLLQNIRGSTQANTSVIYKLASNGKPYSSNPFVDNISNESLDLYYAFGLRNSFGLAIDPVTGFIWDTENGDREYDEINYIFPGFNSGWKKVQGPIRLTNATSLQLTKFPGSQYSDPEFSWTHPIGVTDLEFLNSYKLGPKYAGSLFVGDIHNGNLYFFKLNKTRTGFEFNKDQPGLADLVADNAGELDLSVIGSRFGGITDIATGYDGYLYILTFTGNLYKIVSSP